MDKKYFYNKNALITGAASGIGKEFALQLAKLGTNLIISDINVKRLEQVKNEIEKIGVAVKAIECDVTKNSEVRSLVKEANSFGELHFLFSNAGLAVGGQYDFISKHQWKNIIDINIWGNINVISAFLPKMVEQGFGHVIVTSSIAGIVGVGGLIPYSTTKFANYGFCEALYGEFYNKGIEVSVVCPFPIKTNLIENAQFSLDPERLKDASTEKLQDVIEIGKKHYWEEFTKSGIELKKAVKIFLKKISKKKLYICERKSLRLMYFIKGLYPKLHKRLIRKVSSEHAELLEETYQMCYDILNEN